MTTSDPDDDDVPLVGSISGRTVVVANKINTVNITASSSPESPGWLRVRFEDQQSIEAALNGDSLRPTHVAACPPVLEVTDLVERLQRSGYATIVGDSGSGKSMVAWHAAYELHQKGWRVFHLLNPTAAIGEPPGADAPTLLVIDDAQALPSLPINPTVVDRNRHVLLVSTTELPGFRGVIRLDTKRAVETIATALNQRATELAPLLAKFDRHVGDGYLDISVDTLIESAKRSSDLPWQFMFNLGGGAFRLRKQLAQVHSVPAVDTLLYLISCYQLASKNRRCPIEWLKSNIERYTDVSQREVPQLIETLNQIVPLILSAHHVTTPHPQIATKIIVNLFYEKETQRHQQIFWDMALDRSYSLVGIHWLIQGAGIGYHRFAAIPDNVIQGLIERCFSEADPNGAGTMLAWLMRMSTLTKEVIESRTPEIVQWINDVSPAESAGLRELLNSIINSDRRWACKFIDYVSTVAVAQTVNASTIHDGYFLGTLIGRLSFGSDAWCAQLATSLDADRIALTYSRCTQDDLYSASEFVRAIMSFDEALALRLARLLIPTIAEAIAADVTVGIQDSREILWWVLRFGAPEFLSKRRPDATRLEIGASIVDAIGHERFVALYTNARHRDWDPLQTLSTIVHYMSPESVAALAQAIDVTPQLQVFRGMHPASHEFDCALGALAFGDKHEPAATLVREILVPTGKLTIRSALISPASAVDVVLAGGEVDLQLKGGLPRWDFAAVILFRMHAISSEAARTLLRVVSGDLADGFLFRQSDGGKGAVLFMKVARRVDESALAGSMGIVDPGLANVHWRQRAQGTDDERAILAQFLHLAQQAGGAMGDLAIAIQTEFALSPNADEGDDDEDLQD